MPHDSAPALPATAPLDPPAPRPLLHTRDVASLVVGIVIGAGMFSVPAGWRPTALGRAALNPRAHADSMSSNPGDRT